MSTHSESLSIKTESLAKDASAMGDAFCLLTSQHHDIELLFDHIKEPGAGQSRGKLVAQLLHQIEGHAAIEEQVLYPAAKAVDKAFTLKAIEEHDLVKNILAKLRDTSTLGESFNAKMIVLRELLEQHFRAEEATFFPAVKEALGEQRVAALTADLEQALERFNRKPVAVKLAAKRAAASKRPLAASRGTKVAPGSKPRSAHTAAPGPKVATASKARGGRPSAKAARRRAT